MRLIHSGGFDRDERLQWRVVIFGNLRQACQVVLQIMRENGMDFAHAANRQYVPLFEEDRDIATNEPFPRQFHLPMASFWADAGVAAAVRRGSQYALQDNLSYFFEHIDRLFANDYVPNDSDVLRARLRTTGISETIFELGSLTYRMFDVGGQRSERKKWIHVVSGIRSL